MGSRNGPTGSPTGSRPGCILPLYTATSDGAVLVDGFKLRMLLVSPDAAQRQFFYGVNFEFSFNTHHWDPHRYTSEIRPIIGWHLGRLDLIFNPILDNSYDGFPGLDFAPATRIAFNVLKLILTRDLNAPRTP